MIRHSFIGHPSLSPSPPQVILTALAFVRQRNLVVPHSRTWTPQDLTKTSKQLLGDLLFFHLHPRPLVWSLATNAALVAARGLEWGLPLQVPVAALVLHGAAHAVWELGVRRAFAKRLAQRRIEGKA